MNSKTGIKNLVILGAGGFAREVAWLVSDINRAQPEPQWNLIGFWGHDGDQAEQSLNGIPILTPDSFRQYLPELWAVIAIGSPLIKEKAVKEASDFGCKFATLIHPTVLCDKATVDIGEGSILCAGNILTVNIKIGSHVILNLDCTVGHDSVIEDLVTVSPGVHLSGYTTIRKRGYIGTGAVTVERHEIGEGSVIGAGAVVVKDIPAGVTAVGLPARPLNK